MSKAFTSEETELQTISRPRPAAGGEPRYVTPEGHRALQAQLARLQAERAQAAAQGATAVASTADLDDQIAALSDTLDVLTVVQPDASQSGRVFFGASVTLEDEDGHTSRYRIVGPDEADAKAGLVSVASPLSLALLGKEEGDEVVVERPRGAAAYTIVSVEYPHA
jgi:transcription elongation factor GreB